MVHGYQLNPTVAYKTNRSLVRTQIGIHQLVFITALVLIPLLVWHIATLEFFEDYRMGAKEEDSLATTQGLDIEKQLKEEQLSESNKALWAVVWILVCCACACGKKMGHGSCPESD